MLRIKGKQTMPNDKKQTCIISVSFPVDSDEQAVEYKRKITSVLAEMPAAKISLMLMNNEPPPTKPTDG